ncbi:PASTA domain-containing protein [Actinoplanes sp. NPDC049548]|uniref:PASTA domain-containing protein n=1 Tax=Actinoplanes sp. NPDC049548 TaxID=3155152 RepID=UPI00341A903E
MSDDTGEFFPFRDESSGEGRKHPNGGPRSGDADDAATRPMPRHAGDADRTELLPAADDATQVTGRPPQPDATAVYSAGENHNWADEDQVWAGRAGVRPPRPGADSTRTDWAAVPADEPRGRWWTPIAVGIVALLLLGVLSWGIYLILQSTGDDEETPAPVVPASAAPARTTEPTSQPTSEPPTTAPTTTEPTSSPPAPPKDVTIPALRGLSLEEARAALNRTGLNYRLRYVASTEAPPGTVIGSDPVEGQQVPGDTVVNLIVAAESTATTPTASTTPPAGVDPD